MIREDNYGNFSSKSKATVRIWKLLVKGEDSRMEKRLKKMWMDVDVLI